MWYQPWLGTKPDHYLTSTRGTTVPGHCFIFMRSLLCMYRKITLKWHTATWGVRRWVKESLWKSETWTARNGKKWSVKILLRQQQFCCPVILWAFIWLFPHKEGQKTLYSNLSIRGEDGSTNSYIPSSLTPPLLLWPQERQHSISVMLQFQSRKGIQWPHCVRHISRFLSSRVFAPNPNSP